MFPFTNAAMLPNMGLLVTAGSFGSRALKAEVSFSPDFGIDPFVIGLADLPGADFFAPAWIRLGVIDLD